MTESKSQRDKMIGENLSRLRGELTQQSLADLMRERGFEWTQATVWAIEKGRRPLRLTEAEALAKLMRVDIATLLELPSFMRLNVAVNDLIQAETDLTDAAERFEDSLHGVAYYADVLIADGMPPESVNEALVGMGIVRFEENAIEYLQRRNQVNLRINDGEPVGKYMSRYLRREAGADDGKH